MNVLHANTFEISPKFLISKETSDCQLSMGELCFLNTNVVCPNQNECETNSGECSDSEFLIDLPSITCPNIPTYNFQDNRYGGCIIDRLKPESVGDDVPYFQYVVLPFCKPGVTGVFPTGCVDPSIRSR